MNQTLMVVMMALGMFVSTFLIGYLPTKFNPPQKWLNLISIYGAGLLVGAAIIVILPEGMLVLFESLVNKEVLQLFEAMEAGHNHQMVNNITEPLPANQTRVLSLQNADAHGHGHGSGIVDPRVIKFSGLSLIFGFTLMLVLDQGFLIIQEKVKNKEHKHYKKLEDAYNNVVKHDESSSSFRQQKQSSLERMIGGGTGAINNNNETLQQLKEPLLLHSPKQSTPKDQCSIQQKRESQECHVVESLTGHEGMHVHEHNDHLHAHEHNHGGKQNIIVSTIGLVLHSLADGTALGASVFLSSKSAEGAQNSGLGLIIFFAILLHKAPAAFGFGSFLRHEAVPNKVLINHLLAFTAAAPSATLLAYFGLQFWESEADESQLMFWVGILLLISAGSFLYVATIHILPEVYCNTEIHRPHDHHHLPEDHIHDQDHFNKQIELFTIIVGLMTPYLLFLI